MRRLFGSRGPCPGSAASGSVTVEASFAMVSLILVFAMLLQGMSVIALNSALTSCVREAARAAAVQLDPTAAQSAAREQVHRCQPGAELEMVDGVDYLDLTVVRRIHLFGLPHTVTLRSSASTLKEPSW